MDPQFHDESADQNEKISQAQKYRNNRYFLPVSILFFKALVSIVPSIWYRYQPIPIQYTQVNSMSLCAQIAIAFGFPLF